MRPLARRNPELGGLRVLLVGLGRSGMAAAGLLARRGARVLATDRRTEDALGAAAGRIRELGFELHAGGHPASLADGCDLVVVSPGVPVAAEPLRAARRAGIPVWGEIELAARFCRGRIVGVSGSNGKSTVTSMIGHVLRHSGIPGGTGGNLATPLAELLDQDGPDAVHAVELSSFQLETVECLDPVVAVITNLSPDHLDRYASFDEYAAAKARLLAVQAEDSYAVLNADDAPSQRFRPAVRGRPHLFSTRTVPERGAFLRGDRLVLRLNGDEELLLESKELTVRGEHNVANALAAALTCRLVGCAPEAIGAALRTFRGLPHRLERLGAVGGVEFYNDSKATNPDSALRALAAFEPGAVHLIAGGRDKGADWTELVATARNVVRRVLLVGEAAAMLRERFGDTVELVDCGTVAAAVETGFAGARPGDVVLLSPGCASFDQYADFEQRGADFGAAVSALARREAGGA